MVFGHMNEPRVLTSVDYERIRDLADDFAPHAAPFLDAAKVVEPPAIPRDVVTMYSQFQIRERSSPQPRTLVLCYPVDAEPASGYLSILSPAGLALLGLHVGGKSCWIERDGTAREAVVTAILFQPEATGDYVT